MPSGIQVPECESRPPFRSASLLMQLWRGGALPFLSSMKDPEHTRKKNVGKGRKQFVCCLLLSLPPLFCGKENVYLRERRETGGGSGQPKKKRVGGKRESCLFLLQPAIHHNSFPPFFSLLPHSPISRLSTLHLSPAPSFPFPPLSEKKEKESIGFHFQKGEGGAKGRLGNSDKRGFPLSHPPLSLINRVLSHLLLPGLSEFEPLHIVQPHGCQGKEVRQLLLPQNLCILPATVLLPP